MRAASTAWIVGGSVALGADRDELLEEQRVALGAVDDPRRAPRPAPSARDERARVVVAERVEHEHRRGPAAAPPTPGRDSSSSGRARQTSRIGAPLENAAR